MAMNRPGRWKGLPWSLLTLYIFLDLLATALGMGVPFLNILLGFPVGWVLARQAPAGEPPLRFIWRGAWLTVGVTFLMMAAIWLPQARNLFNPAFDFSQSGVPHWLYDPKLSYIGWLALMVLVSPFLQLLTTLAAAFIVLLRKEQRDNPRKGDACVAPPSSRQLDSPRQLDSSRSPVLKETSTDSMQRGESLGQPNLYGLDNGAPVCSLSPFADPLAELRFAFAQRERPFLRFTSFPDEAVGAGFKPARTRTWTRGQFWDLACLAAARLNDLGLGKGERVLHCFSANSPYDLAFRLGESLIGAVPVTVNWQADNDERVLHKAEITSARILLSDFAFR
ncbi:MAG: hypothetical protein NTV33_11545, partial [Coprothermobacterota bacterium]|nr:hypothetical protein [Coprothermobacterota bacterium]